MNIAGPVRRRDTVAILAAVIPLVSIHASYCIAVVAGHLPLCVPHLSGCTSTSATGRVIPEALLFKPGMLAAAVSIGIFWWRCGTGTTQRRVTGPVMRGTGIVAAVSLAAYTMALGVAGETFGMVRRLGIDGFFVGNFVAQIALLATRHDGGFDQRAGPGRLAVWLCLAVPALVAAGEAAKLAGWPDKAVNNVVAWNAIVLTCAFYAAVGRRRATAQPDGPAVSKRSSGAPASPRE